MYQIQHVVMYVQNQAVKEATKQFLLLAFLSSKLLVLSYLPILDEL